MSANSPSSNLAKTDFRLRAGAAGRRHFLTSLIIMVPSSNMLKLRRLRGQGKRTASARCAHGAGDGRVGSGAGWLVGGAPAGRPLAARRRHVWHLSSHIPMHIVKQMPECHEPIIDAGRHSGYIHSRHAISWVDFRGRRLTWHVCA